MNEPQRLKPCIILPEEIPGPDPLSLGAVTLSMPFDVPEGPRTKSELERFLREAKVNSVEDICKAFDVRIRGSYVHASGATVQVALRAEGEETFSVRGLTLLDPHLQEMHIRSRTYDECARYLSDKRREFLDEEEIAHLETTARILEDSEEENENE